MKLSKTGEPSVFSCQHMSSMMLSLLTIGLMGNSHSSQMEPYPTQPHVVKLFLCLTGRLSPLVLFKKGSIIIDREMLQNMVGKTRGLCL